MSRRTLCLLSLCVLLVAMSGCAALLGSSKDSGPEEVSAEQRRKLREMGGEELVADVERFVAVDKNAKGRYQSTQCMREYLTGLKKEQEPDKHDRRSKQSTFRNCEIMCAKAVEFGVEVDLTQKYTDKCAEKVAYYKGSWHLERAAEKLDEYENAEGAFGIYRSRGPVAGAYSQAVDALGEDDERVVAFKEKFDAVDAKHADVLERVRAFRSRDDIKKIEGQRDQLEAQLQTIDGQIRELEQDIEMYREAESHDRVDALQQQLGGKQKIRSSIKGRLDKIYKAWRAEAQKAGLVPAS